MLHATQLQKLDLNLLVALDVLLCVNELGQAADVLGVNQAALGHTLLRLREAFDDELLVEGNGGLVRTARAQALAQPLQQALFDLQHALSADNDFDPANSSQQFTVAASVDMDRMLPKLMELIAARAPAVNIEWLALEHDDILPALEAGAVELAVCHPLRSNDSVYQRLLFADNFCCATRQGHAAIDGDLDLDRYLSLSHIDIDLPAGRRGAIDHVLARLGLQRRVALRLPQLSTAAAVLLSTELIVTAPRRDLQAWAALLPLQLHEAPLKLTGFTVSMAWHERMKNHPAHCWLRDQLVAAGR